MQNEMLMDAFVMVGAALAVAMGLMVAWRNIAAQKAAWKAAPQWARVVARRRRRNSTANR